MNNIINAINTILILGAIQGIILGWVLLKRSRRNKVANELLAAILFLFSFSILLHTVAHFLEIPFLSDHHPLIIGIGLINLGPLFYLYVRTLTQSQSVLIVKNTCHFIPFLFCLLIILPIHFLSANVTVKKVTGEMVFATAFVIAGVYVIISARSLFLYSRKIRQKYSTIEMINLKWLNFLTFCIVLIWVPSIFLHRFFGENAGEFIWLVTSVVIYLIGYFGWAQPETFSGIIFEEGLSVGKEKKKYEKSVLTAEMTSKHYERLVQIMETEQLYLDSDLTLSKLAEQLTISTHHLSQIINETIGQSFYDYINSNRIKYAQKQLISPENQHLNISSIGFESGFNSLSAFNSAFKKFTGITPSQFKKQSKM